MGGFAADISWNAPPQPDIANRMIAMVPHRATAGATARSFDGAVLAECHTTRTNARPEIASVGPLSMVGDLRLWNKDRLTARAGGSNATRDTDDRHLVLEAYARTGIEFLDAVDGDFAFVIWNNKNRTVLAVRDRFGAKPLFYERSPAGIRFASEIKQLVTVSGNAPAPCASTVAEFLLERYQATDLTFFEGIQKVRPAEYVEGSESRFSTTRYWTPSFNEPIGIDPADVPHLFREQLVASVKRRVESSRATTIQVTGGLDSSSISAAATLLPDLLSDTRAIQTASAVFPGQSVDESYWIDQIVAQQPFAHVSFVPKTESIEQYKSTMWSVDGLLFNRITGMWAGTAGVALDSGSDLVLMGAGGDEVLAQRDVTSDLLRFDSLDEWWHAIWAESSRAGGPIIPILWSLKQLAPSRVKRPIRKLIDRRAPALPTIVDSDLLTILGSATTERPVAIDAPSRTQARVATSAWHPLRILLNETQEAEFADRGIDVSYPYLDRDLVEFVTSLTPAIRPLDGYTKTLVRAGFADCLPPSVLGRTRKTIADEYLADVFDRLAAEYRERYPAVSDVAAFYLSEDAYATALIRFEGTRSARRQLWDAWTLMEWLDGLDRYLA